MTKENRNLLINGLAFILVGVLMVLFFVFFIPTSQGDKLVGTKVKYEEVSTKGMPSTIKAVNKLNKGKKLVGTLYEASKTNSYGEIEIFVAIDEEGKILGIDSNVDQSIGKELTKVFVKNYKGSNIIDPKVVDGTTAPTVAISLGTVDELLEDVAIASGFVNDTIYDILFGKDHKLNSVEFEANKSILSQEVVVVNNEFKANVYLAKATGKYNTDDSTEKSIEIKFIVDTDNKLIGFEEINYGHTGGSFKSRITKYLDKLIADELDLTDITDKLEDVTGSTNSGLLINEMLKDLSEVVASSDHLKGSK